MGNSLRDQLVKGGVASQQDAKKAMQAKKKANKSQKQLSKKDKQAQQMQQHEQQRQKRQALADQSAQQSALEQQKRQQKAAQAQALDLLKTHALNLNSKIKPEQADYYSYRDQNKIHELPVTAEQKRQLASQKLKIIVCKHKPYLVPAEVAAKVEKFDPALLAEIENADQGRDEHDYSDEQYQVPDDLVW